MAFAIEFYLTERFCGFRRRVTTNAHSRLRQIVANLVNPTTDCKFINVDRNAENAALVHIALIAQLDCTR